MRHHTCTAPTTSQFPRTGGCLVSDCNHLFSPVLVVVRSAWSNVKKSILQKIYRDCLTLNHCPHWLLSWHHFIKRSVNSSLCCSWLLLCDILGEATAAVHREFGLRQQHQTSLALLCCGTPHHPHLHLQLLCHGTDHCKLQT